MIGQPSIHLLAGTRPPGALALMYHAIGGTRREAAWPWRVTLQRFRAHLDLLERQGWRTLTIAELVEANRVAGEREVVITFDDGYVDNLEACAELGRRGMRATWFVVTDSLGRMPVWEDDGRPAQRLLDAIELRGMLMQGMEIGSHGCSHRRLPPLDDRALKQEVVDSRATLEQLLGVPVTSFAFPYGSYDARSTAAVRAAGYTAACTTQSGWALLDRDPFSLRRLSVLADDTADVLARKLALVTNDASWGRVARYWWTRARARLGA